jgi:hypothetical protein
MIGTGRWRSEPPCARQGVPHGQTESGGIVLAGICWSPRAHRRCSLIPDRALCLPTFSHVLIANKTTLSLSLSLSPARARLTLSVSVFPQLSRKIHTRTSRNTCVCAKRRGAREQGKGASRARQDQARTFATPCHNTNKIYIYISYYF